MSLNVLHPLLSQGFDRITPWNGWLAGLWPSIEGRGAMKLAASYGAATPLSCPVKKTLPFSLFLAAVCTLVLLWRAYGEEKPKSGPEGISSVWVVESGKNKIYLAGSIHLLREQDYPLPGVFDKAYEDSNRVVFELPPGSEGDGEVIIRMRQMGSFPQEDDLSKHVSSDTYKRTIEWADKNQFPASTIRRFRPWFLALTIAALEYQQLGAAADRGLDSHYEKEAKADGKKGDGLESVEYQLSLFSKLNDKLQEELLLQTLSEVESMKKDYEDLVVAWRSGDSAKLQQFLFKDADKYPELMEEFLFKRNKAWITKLEQYLKSGDRAFVVVGAGHLGGEKGVLELLRQKGCKVTQMQLSGANK